MSVPQSLPKGVVLHQKKSNNKIGYIYIRSIYLEYLPVSVLFCCLLSFFQNIEITNFSSCWVDGLAFCAIYHSYLPSHVPYDKLSPDNKAIHTSYTWLACKHINIGVVVIILMILSTERESRSCIPDWRRFWNLCVTGGWTVVFNFIIQSCNYYTLIQPPNKSSNALLISSSLNNK